MSYTKRNFALRLKQQLNDGYDVVKISRWAHREFLENCSKLEPGLQAKMMKIVVMEEGPEFEMTELEIREFVNDLEA